MPAGTETAFQKLFPDNTSTYSPNFKILNSKHREKILLSVKEILGIYLLSCCEILPKPVAFVFFVEAWL